MSVHIKSDGEEALLTGDVAHHSLPDGPSRLVVDRRFRSPDIGRHPRELFSRFADTPTLVIGGHFNAGHIKRDGDAFRFMALSVVGAAA